MAAQLSVLLIRPSRCRSTGVKTETFGLLIASGRLRYGGAKGEDAPADVYVKSRADNVPRLLFKLNRDGTIYLGNGNGLLLLEDQQFSNTYRLLLFDLDTATQSETDALRISKDVRSDIIRKLSPGEDINYYFPKFIAWAARDVVISVGVVTVTGNSGPFTPHCFGYEIGTHPIHIKSVLSETDLKRRYGASCQIWP